MYGDFDIERFLRFLLSLKDRKNAQEPKQPPQLWRQTIDVKAEVVDEEEKPERSAAPKPSGRQFLFETFPTRIAKRQTVDFLAHNGTAKVLSARVKRVAVTGYFLRRYRRKRGKLVPIGKRDFFRPGNEVFPRESEGKARTVQVQIHIRHLGL